jgi:O-antigen ligase
MSTIVAPQGALDREGGDSEPGMRLMLSFVVFFLALSDIFAWQLSLAPGLSAKNAMLYVLAVVLIFKYAVQGGFRLELPGIYVCFAILIGYAILSMLNAALLVDYPRYHLFKSAIKLKSLWLDQLVFFAVFFFAIHSSRNALAMIKVLLLAVVIANGVAVLDALGVVQVGELVERQDGRVQGAMGESNQYGAFIALFLPALTNMALLQSRGVMRIAWLAGLFVSACALLMTVSRGAFVGMIVAGLWGAYLFRRHVSLGRIAAWAGGAVALIIVTLGALGARYGTLLYERILQQSSTGMEDASSGRSQIWTDLVTRMMETPLTLLTGFGWDVYGTMPFHYSAHNHYLSLWFNLGLVGLICGVLLLIQIARRARAAVDLATERYRWLLITFVVGTMALAVATFFVELYSPWIWFWAYGGLMMRIAVNTRNALPLRVALEDAPQVVGSERSDIYGWNARPQAVQRTVAGR